MNPQPGANQRSNTLKPAITPAQLEAHCQYCTDCAPSTLQYASYRRPTCLLAIGIHEVGRAAATLRRAQAIGNDELGRRAERELEGWSHLYEFTCQRICPALRIEAIVPEAAPGFADAALAAMPATVPDDIRAYLRDRLTTCASYRTANDCPFLNPSQSEAADAEIAGTAYTH